MTITSYSELKTALTAWYEDRSDLSAYTDEFIDLAEAWLNTTLRCRQMEAVSDLTPTAGVCTLPGDYLEARRVVEKASIRRPLAWIAPATAESLYPSRVGGLSCHYTIVGESLYTFPLAAGDIELTYYQKLPALSDANTSNWLLAALPNLYLHAGLMMAAEFVRDEARMKLEADLAGAYVARLAALDERANVGNAGVTLSMVTP